MNVYFCNGCTEYKNSDIDGRHENDCGFICDECECLDHMHLYKQSMENLAKLMNVEY